MGYELRTMDKSVKYSQDAIICANKIAKKIDIMKRVEKKEVIDWTEYIAYMKCFGKQCNI